MSAAEFWPIWSAAGSYSGMRPIIIRFGIARERAPSTVLSISYQLAALYQERRVAVITQIYSKPVKKVQTFADAFRFRREP
jgi:hypothetical protein